MYKIIKFEEFLQRNDQIKLKIDKKIYNEINKEI